MQCCVVVGEVDLDLLIAPYIICWSRSYVVAWLAATTDTDNIKDNDSIAQWEYTGN